MFALVITVLSIALVAALALATVYYGGAAFGKGAARAQATKIALQGQQLLAAADLYYNDNHRWPATLTELVAGNYLKQVPVADASGPAEALAAGVTWTMPIQRQPMFLLGTESPEVCAEVNLAVSLGKKAILAHAYSGLASQCYGATAGTLQTVLRKNTDVPFNEAGAGLRVEDIRAGLPPLDPADPDWFVAPGAAPPAPVVVLAGDASGVGTSPRSAGGLQVTYTQVSFANALAEDTSLPVAQPVLTNTGAQTVYLNGLTASDFLNFPVSLGDCGVVLLPGASCALQLQFRPTGATAEGLKTSTANLASSDGSVTFALSGTGLARTAPVSDTPVAGALEVSFTRVTFSDTYRGSITSPATAAVVTNRTSGAVTITDFAVSDTVNFHADRGSCSAALEPGASCELNMQFMPAMPGQYAAGAALVTSTGSVSFSLAGKALPRPATDFVLQAGGVFTPSAVGGPVQTVVYTATLSAPSGFSFIDAQVSDASWSIESNGCAPPGVGDCALTLKWSPASFGQKTGTLRLTLQDDSGRQHTHAVALSNYANPEAGTTGAPFVGSAAAAAGGGTTHTRTLGMNFDYTPVGVPTALGSTDGEHLFSLTQGQSVYEPRFETDNSAFTVASSCPKQLDFGAACNFEVTFKPTQNGPYAGHLYVSYFDGAGVARDTHVIDIFGSGGPPPAPQAPVVSMCDFPVLVKQHLASGYQPNRLGVDQFLDPPGWYNLDGTSTYFPNGWAYALVNTGTEKRPCN